MLDSYIHDTGINMAAPQVMEQGQQQPVLHGQQQPAHPEDSTGPLRNQGIVGSARGIKTTQTAMDNAESTRPMELLQTRNRILLPTALAIDYRSLC
ncbi:unnamed protein product [Bursaphelenchus okinawaensis]|uniref:Uncharacterized protein n=1 Tax=Bursaphelenchus okinawaensis TaxID=465554 RepID=A0A811JUI3_9BILA|nr:unnamed protein product [Bursaphelenchus okinawaensis]CAG9084181.1 unnamed protein product [Bursaphelenchus okinawaensis]